MPVKSIQQGQVWRNDQTGQNYLVTKLYKELFSEYVMLRVADATASTAESVRVKIQKEGANPTLPGYTYAQEAQEF